LTVHKYYNDHFYLNSYLAHIGGLELSELNHLERMFLEILDFNLSIDMQEYDNYKTGLTAFYAVPLNENIMLIKRNIDQQIEQEKQRFEKIKIHKKEQEEQKRKQKEEEAL
jgi:hypothetical protein